MTVRMKDVAQRAGVSTATVSHVINGTRCVSEDLVAKVRQAMKELAYSPNPAARSLRTQASRTIGLVVPMLESDTSNVFFMNIAHGVHSVLREQGYNLVLANSLEAKETEEVQLRSLAAQMLDGFIVAPVSDGTVDYAESLGDRPLVYIDRRPANAWCDCVTADGKGGVEKAALRFIRAGHRRIGFLSGVLNISTSSARLEGYKSALAQAGLAYDTALVRVGPATFESGRDLARQLLDDHGDVTAILSASNILTMGAFGYLRESAIRVPEDVALIGFDDYDWTRVTSPPLTVIRQPAYAMGRKAAELVLARLAKEEAPVREWTLPTELIVRESG